jgi:hypothetical protein
LEAIDMTTRQFAVLTIVGGILAAAGSLLPWATISSGFGTIDLAGTRGDGVLTLVLGAALALVGFVRYGGQGPNWLAGLGTVIGLGVLAIGAYDYLNLQSRLSGSGNGIDAGAGVGLYLVILGGAAGLFGGMKGKAEPVTPLSPPPSA